MKRGWERFRMERRGEGGIGGERERERERERELEIMILQPNVISSCRDCTLGI